MEGLNIETLLGNKETVDKEEKRRTETHREREKEMSRCREDAIVADTQTRTGQKS